MKLQTLILSFILCLGNLTKAQNNLILNGSFEINNCDTAAVGNTYEGQTNNSYSSLMQNSWGFGSDMNIDILKLNSNFCGAAQDGIWYVALTSGGTDAFSLKCSDTIKTNKQYNISFYTRAVTNYFPGSVIKIGLSNTDTTFGVLVDSVISPPENCQWIKNQINFISNVDAMYVTVQCGGTVQTSYNWTHVDNFLLDTGIIYNDIIKVGANNFKINIYPNPSNGNINVTYKLSSNGVLTITDINSKIVSKYNLPSSVTTMHINNDFLENGVYFYNLSNTEGLVKTGRIVIIK